MRYLIVFLICLTFIISQDSRSIHQRELEYHNEHYTETPSSQEKTRPMDLQPRTVVPSHTIFGYHPYWQGTSWQSYDYNLLTTIAYFSAEVAPNGDLTNLHGWPVTGLINEAHSHGVKVVLCATLFSESGLTILLSSAANRQNLIDNLLTQVQAGNADGVNIDFEAFPSSQTGNMVTFITDLTNAFHTAIPGSEVTIATPAVDWSNEWNLNALASICDGLFIMGYDYHWSSAPTIGAVAPLTGYNYNVTNTVDYYLSHTGNNSSKLILGCPYYGFDWPAESGLPGANTTGTGSSRTYAAAEPLAQSYGKMWHNSSQTPWYNYQSTEWHQGWYDDSLSLSLKYDLALDNNLQGVGMWALGYDGSNTELWDALESKFGGDGPPGVPEDVSVLADGNGSLTISFSEPSGVAEFIVLQYDNTGSIVTGHGPYNQSPIILENETSGIPFYFRLYAQNSHGTSSNTELLGAVPGSENDILVIHGFDRTSGTTNTFDAVLRHGNAIHEAGYGFDAVSNEVIENGSVDLSSYSVVDWVLGEEGSTTHSFSYQEQNVVTDYLENGGNLFVSGSEIGYDLVAQGSSSDQQFYADYLKADYIVDNTNVYSVFPPTNSILSSVGTFSFDDGTHGSYDTDYPDGIKPVGGATTCLKYSGVDYNSEGGAGINYFGNFGSSSTPGAIVYLAIGFESVYYTEQRNDLMQAILTWFYAVNDAEDQNYLLPDDLQISSIYPNPTNASVTISFNQAQSINPATLSIYNALGEMVFSHNIGPNSQVQHIEWNGESIHGYNVSSGIYFARLTTGLQSQSVKFTVLK